MDFTGKTRDEIVASLADKPRSALVEMIVSMASVEQWFKPGEIAARRRMNVRDVRKAMKAGKLGGGYYRRAANSMLVPASAIAAWDRSFFIATNKKEDRAHTGFEGEKIGAKRAHRAERNGQRSGQKVRKRPRRLVDHYVSEFGSMDVF
jgi:hypothetical protein